MKRIRTAVAALALAASMLGAADVSAATNGAWKKQAGTYAVIETRLGTIVGRLFPEQSPKTVANFVGLAEGTKEFTDPKTNQKAKRAFYDGTIFHRVIPKFMIQGGDPLGMGYGGPGYKFEDEFSPTLNFNKTGMLAMANAGPNTNGSQFFITVAPQPGLNDGAGNGHYTIFGEVVEGQEVANAISQESRDPNDRPLKTVSMTVKIVRVK
jgi:peptidyl-prolyl cis-trans isomerase A (cyclophilin A)